jgi:4-diphosphocytidyl-2-C-methyl-D-erythritol kinase
MNTSDDHSIRIRAPAKINLFLKVMGKRPDNYHELCTLMCPIRLYDTLTLTFGVEKTLTFCSHPDVPAGETNLAHRAAEVFLELIDSREGVCISIEKKIPVAAGLGGGSSDAASVLLAMNRHYGYPLSKDRLIEAGCRIGADVPFFIFQKPALATGIGEKLESVAGLTPYRVLLVNPGFKVLTAEIFKNCNFTLTNREKVLKNPLFIDSAFDISRDLINDLEMVTGSRFPEIFSIKSLLLRYGAMGAAMSGSGPTVFGLFTDLTAAETALDAFRADQPRWQVFLVDLLV